MYQFLDHLNFKIAHCADRSDNIGCLAYAHYEFVRIHPFNNGNGRTGRMLMNVVALKLGYRLLNFIIAKATAERYTFMLCAVQTKEIMSRLRN